MFNVFQIGTNQPREIDQVSLVRNVLMAVTVTRHRHIECFLSFLLLLAAWHGVNESIPFFAFLTQPTRHQQQCGKRHKIVCAFAAAAAAAAARFLRVCVHSAGCRSIVSADRSTYLCVLNPFNLHT